MRIDVLEKHVEQAAMKISHLADWVAKHVLIIK